MTRATRRWNHACPTPQSPILCTGGNGENRVLRTYPSVLSVTSCANELAEFCVFCAFCGPRYRIGIVTTKSVQSPSSGAFLSDSRVKARFIFNPHSGSNRRNPHLRDRAQEFIKQHGWDATVVATERPRHATDLARHRKARFTDLVAHGTNGIHRRNTYRRNGGIDLG